MYIQSQDEKNLLDLKSYDRFLIEQRKELWEWVGLETRNRYQVMQENGRLIGYVSERNTGFLGAIFRLVFKHWRPFDLDFYNLDRELKYTAHHPFRFYFSELQLKGKTGEILGFVKRRFAIFTKSFDIENAQGFEVMRVRSGLFRIWTFEYHRGPQKVATVSKKWGGVLKEVFTDADRFFVEFHTELTNLEKNLILVSAMHVDLMYFENNQGANPIDLLGD